MATDLSLDTIELYSFIRFAIDIIEFFLEKKNVFFLRLFFEKKKRFFFNLSS